MKIEELKKEYVGKTIKLIADLKKEGYARVKQEIIPDSYNDIDEVKVIFIKENDALIFIDQDCDGYRSGDWNLAKVELLVEAGLENVKPINSKILDIKKYETGSKTGLIIYTEAYVIDMGQDNSDSYYPCNYFDIGELEKGIIGKGKLIELE